MLKQFWIDLRVRLAALFGRHELYARADEEMQFHLAMREQPLIEEGVPFAEACVRARREFGNPTLFKEKTLDSWRYGFVDTFIQDLSHARRMLRRTPGFTAVAALSLALGIGANTAVFSILDAALLTDLPVTNPEQLVVVTTQTIQSQGSPGSFRYGSFSFPVFQAVAAQQHVFTEMAASGSLRPMHVLLGGIEFQELDQIRGSWVSANYFQMLGLKPALGRLFTSGDSTGPEVAAVAVLGYEFWERRLARDPAIVGKTVMLDDLSLTVIGVAPAGFTSDRRITVVDIWVPITMAPRNMTSDRRITGWFRTFARLKPGATPAQAGAELTTLYQQTIAAAGVYRGRLSDLRVQASDSPDGMYPEERTSTLRPFLLLMAVSGLVLLIACCNIANLLLVRGSVRQREIAIRLAIGSSRRRLIALLLTESIVLATIGGLSGLAVAYAGTRVLGLFSGGILPATLDVRPDGTVLLFTAGISLIAGISFGLFPAVRATAINLDSALRTGIRDSSGGRGKQTPARLLVISQVAICLVLLMGAGLIIRTLQNLRAVDFGVDHNRLLLLSVAPEHVVNPSQFSNLRRRIQERIQALPNVRSASFSAGGLYSSSTISSPVQIPGSAVDPGVDANVRTSWVSPGFFETVGARVIVGRLLTDRDAEGRGAVVNEVFARRYFGGENPLGRTIYLPQEDFRGNRLPFGPQLADAQSFEIIGMVRDTKDTPRGAPLPTVYLPLAQRSGFGSMLYVRTEVDAAGLTGPILQILKEFNHDVVVSTLRTLEEQVTGSLAEERLLVKLLSVVAVLALVLSTVGLFGVVSYTVTRRTSEIGIRMALGARTADVLALVIRESLILIGAGAFLGIPLALATTRFLEYLLWGLKPPRSGNRDSGRRNSAHSRLPRELCSGSTRCACRSDDCVEV